MVYGSEFNNTRATTVKEKKDRNDEIVEYPKEKKVKET